MQVGSLCNFLTLTFVAVLVAFTVPKAYDMNRREIDKLLGSAKEKGTEFANEAKAFIDEKVISKLRNLKNSATKKRD